MVGGHICSDAPLTIKVIQLGREVDITNKSLVHKVLDKYRPNAVFNFAAVTNVDCVEKTKDLADKVNYLGPEILTNYCREKDILLLHASSDYVFSGNKGFYSEEDQPDPINQYGKSKSKSEFVVQSWRKHYIFRFSFIYGFIKNSPISMLSKSLKTSVNIKAASDLICSPTYIGHLSPLIWSAFQKKIPFGIYNLGNDGYCSRYDFFHSICEKMSLKKPYPISSLKTKDLGLIAKRPLGVRLDFSKWKREFGKLPTVEEGINKYLIDADEIMDYLRNINE